MTQKEENGGEFGGRPYACPECAGDHIAAGALERKAVYIDGEGQETDDAGGGHTEFDGGFRCTDCGHQWGEASDLERAVEDMGRASYAVMGYLSRAEEGMFYQVLNALQAELEAGEEKGADRG